MPCEFRAHRCRQPNKLFAVEWITLKIRPRIVTRISVLIQICGNLDFILLRNAPNSRKFHCVFHVPSVPEDYHLTFAGSRSMLLPIRVVEKAPCFAQSLPLTQPMPPIFIVSVLSAFYAPPNSNRVAWLASKTNTY